MTSFNDNSNRKADVIDYRLVGDDLQAVVVTLDPQEQVIAEAGAFFYMQDGIDMQTSMSTDKNKGFFGNLIKAAGRMLTGESFFVTTFTNQGMGRCICRALSRKNHPHRSC